MQRDYTLNFVAQTSSWTTSANDVLTKINQIHAAATSLKAAMAGMFPGAGAGGVGAGFTNFFTTIGGIDARMQTLNATANSFNRQINTLDASTRNYNRTVNVTNNGHSAWGLQIGRISAAYLGLRAARAIVNELNEQVAIGAENAKRYAQEMIKLRLSVAELLAIKGGAGSGATTTSVTGDVLAASMASFATPAQAREFDVAFSSEIDQMKRSGMFQLNAAEESKFKQTALAFSIAKGMDPAKTAEIASTMTQFRDKPFTSSAEAMASMNMVQKMMVLGRGKFEPLQAQIAKIAPKFATLKAAGSPEESAAMVGAASLKEGNVGRTASHLEIIQRTFAQPKNPQQSAFLESLKIPARPEGMFLPERLMIINQWFDKMRAEKKSPWEELRKKGFTDQRGLVEAMTAAEFAPQMMEMVNEVRKGGQIGQAEADIAAWQRENPEIGAGIANENAGAVRGSANQRTEGAFQFFEAQQKMEGMTEPDFRVGRFGMQVMNLGGLMGIATGYKDEMQRDQAGRIMRKAASVLGDDRVNKLLGYNKFNRPGEIVFEDLRKMLNAMTPEEYGAVVGGGKEGMDFINKPIEQMRQGSGGANEGKGIGVPGAGGAGPQASMNFEQMERSARIFMVSVNAFADLARRSSGDLAIPDTYRGATPLRPSADIA